MTESWIPPGADITAALNEPEVEFERVLADLARALTLAARRYELFHGVELTLEADPGSARWVRRRGEWAWVLNVNATITHDDAIDFVTLSWPALWSGSASGSSKPAAPTQSVEFAGVPLGAFDSADVLAQPRLGVHHGLYLGRPLSVSHGIRLAAGVHRIPRRLRSGWEVETVISPLIGPELVRRAAARAAVAVRVDRAAGELVLEPGRSPSYLGSDVAAQVAEAFTGSAGDGSAPFDVLAQNQRAELDAKDALLALEPSAHPPVHLARARSRLIGHNDVMADMVLSYFSRIDPNAYYARASTQAVGDKVTIGQKLERALNRVFEAALNTMGRASQAGSSIISPEAGGGTLSRTELAARVSFVGFRGLAQGLRGRSDLRDLDPGWRGTLCPVHTPESGDIGLVRYLAVGVNEALGELPSELADWSDLSASAALIPFINHDDPARASIGSKNLKQAVPVRGRQAPLVATGWEWVLAASGGTLAATGFDTVASVTPGEITTAGQRAATITIGMPLLESSGPDHTWSITVDEGDVVGPGTVLGHAPDVVLEPNPHSADGSAEPVLALGVNALVALMPWHGFNDEDAIVVSESFAARMTSTHIVRVDEPLTPEAWLTPVAVGTEVEPGDALFTIHGGTSSSATIPSPHRGLVTRWARDAGRARASIWLRVERSLDVGDKLSNRHQGKGVVSAILPDADMPRLTAPVGEIAAGTPVEVILNPLGVLRRLNVGQLWETHAGLAALASGSGPRIVGRSLEPEARRVLDEELTALGAPRGRVALTCADGREFSVVVGVQYLLKLDHLASAKLRSRDGDARRSPVSAQPSRTKQQRFGKLSGGAQRMGEMELWALNATGSDVLLADALRDRAGLAPDEADLLRPTLRSLNAHLQSAGLGLTLDGHDLTDPALISGDFTPVASTLGVRTTAMPTDPLPDLARSRLWPAATRAQARASRPNSRHPLYQVPPPPEGLTQAGTRLWNETVHFHIPLPFPLAHPWSKSLDRLTNVPLLPTPFRAFGVCALDHHYIVLATECTADVWADLPEFDPQVLDPAASLSPAQRASLARITTAINEILGTPKGVAEGRQRDSILATLSGKRGLLRRGLLGQSVTHSARGVIVPDPTLEPTQIRLPASIMADLGIPEPGPASTRTDAVVVVNRQPSLHPYSLVALEAVPSWQNSAIALHPMCLPGLAGDFDGDTIAVHRPQSHAARSEALAHLSPRVRLRSTASGALLAKRDLDIALGIAVLGDRVQAEKAADDPFLDLLHEWGVELPTAPWTAAELAQRIVVGGDGNDLKAPDGVARLGELETAGWRNATGWSIGAFDLLADGRDGLLGQAIAAGVAGSAGGVTQLLDRRGLVAPASPATERRDVEGNFLAGLTSEDYFHTSAGALASLAEKKLTTPVAGALTKSLVEIADEVSVGSADCGLEGAAPGAQRRSPLVCQEPSGVCQACYGTLPGTRLAPAIGLRVGVLAGMHIGEQTTQQAMKAFHGGGTTGRLNRRIDELRAVFGYGSALTVGLKPGVNGIDQPMRLREVLAPLVTQGLDDVHAALDPVVTRTVELFDGSVDRVHVEVVLRQLLEAERARGADVRRGHGRLDSRAKHRGRTALERATQHGDASWLLEVLPEHGRHRSALLAGVPRVSVRPIDGEGES